jgi:hypothetical protein
MEQAEIELMPLLKLREQASRPFHFARPPRQWPGLRQGTEEEGPEHGIRHEVRAQPGPRWRAGGFRIRHHSFPIARREGDGVKVQDAPADFQGAGGGRPAGCGQVHANDRK